MLGGEPPFSTFADRGITEDPAEADKVIHGCWEHLSSASEVTMPLDVAPWGATFGMCTDRFGVTWMINIG